MWKKLLFIIVVFGFLSAAYAGTDVIRDYGADQFKNSYSYAPTPLPPPRPIYYAPPPQVNVLVFPAYGYVGPRYCGPRYVGSRVYGVHRFVDGRVHHWR